MMFVLSVLLFGLVQCAELQTVTEPEPIVSEAPVDEELDPVMLEVFAKNDTNFTALGDDDSSLADMKSLVTSMTKGDAKLTAYIIKQLLRLRAKTYAEHKVINARLARKLAVKKREVAAKVVQDKKTALAIAAYAAEVINSKYERLQVNRELRALDRIMAQLNSMADWKSCKSGWRKIGRSCYRNLGRTYAYLAEGKCLAVGGSLIRVDNADDRKAVAWFGRYKDNWLYLGFFRALKTGNWAYLDGQAVNPASWYSWINGGYTNKAYNYVRWYKGWNKLQAAAWNWSAGPLCEHRLAVNLLK